MPLTQSTAPAPTPHPGVRFRYDWTTIGTLRLAVTLFLIIAIPAFAFGFAGAYLDKAMNSGGALMFAGLFLAMVMSGLVVWDYVHKYVAWLSKHQAAKHSSFVS
jgi:hypothetical protein